MGLRHLGLYVNDLAQMKDFYGRVVGLTVTDETANAVFLGADPEREDHELVLARGRNAAPDVAVVEHLALRVPSLEALQAYLPVLKAAAVQIDKIVTHGISLSIYARDPEGNRVELYWPTGVRPPHRYSQPIDLEQEPAAVLRQAEKLLSQAASPLARRFRGP
jgi:catechol-2,3-dioxygenase